MTTFRTIEYPGSSAGERLRSLEIFLLIVEFLIAEGDWRIFRGTGSNRVLF